MEVVRFPSHGGFSVRSIFTFALTVLVAALLWVVFLAPSAHAAPEGRWTDGDAILFDAHAYNLDTTINSQTDAIPEGATVYKAPAQSVGTDRTVMVIYFAPGVDPPAASSASHLTFDYNGTTVSNPHDAQTIQMSPQGDDTTAVAEAHSSCNVDGIGWMICPISVFLAESMDWLYTVIEQFVVTPPLMMETENNGVYIAWNITRSIANVAFVIVFLIIIYSQLTNVGVSNYGLKKLTPRLIVAAVLVNLSFYISAVAIDISNIIGYSIVDIMTGIRESVFQITNDNFGAVNSNPWSYITTIALAGGGAIGGIYYIVNSPFIIVTLLLGLALLALFVLLVLAARQAIIILLVIVSPLAFVANLLPNTEKWFERWRDLFTTMLIFFPAFAFVFGGSQLAGQLIIQNANGNIITVILGLAVQVAPLVITPWLLKFSGGLIGRIAQIANNPRKGLMDRTRNWANEKNQINQGRLQTSKNIGAKGFSILDRNRRARKSLIDEYQNRADANWEGTKRAKKLAERKEDSDLVKSRAHDEHARHINELKAGSGHSLSRKVNLYSRAMEAEEAKAGAEAADAQFGAVTSEYRSGQFDTQGDQRMAAIQERMAKRVMETTAFKRASEGASMIQQYEYAQEINTLTPQTFAGGKTLQEIAAGIDPNGAQRAQASATSVIQEIRAKTIDNMQKIIMFKNPTSSQLVELAQGRSTIDGIAATQDAVAAAIQLTLGGPDTAAVADALQKVDLSFNSYGFTPDERAELQILAGKALESNSSKPPFASAGVIAMLKQGKDFNGNVLTGSYQESGVNDWVRTIINKKKIDSGKLQSAGNDYAQVLLRAVQENPAAISADARAQLLQQLDITLDPTREAFEKLGDSQDTLKALRNLL